MGIIGVGAGTVVRTKGVLGTSALIVDLMNKAMFLKGSESTIKGGSVGTGKVLFKIGKTDSHFLPNHKPENPLAHGSRLNISDL